MAGCSAAAIATSSRAWVGAVTVGTMWLHSRSFIPERNFSSECARRESTKDGASHKSAGLAERFTRSMASRAGCDREFVAEIHPADSAQIDKFWIDADTEVMRLQLAPFGLSRNHKSVLICLCP